MQLKSYLHIYIQLMTPIVNLTRISSQLPFVKGQSLVNSAMSGHNYIPDINTTPTQFQFRVFSVFSPLFAYSNCNYND